MISIPKLIIQIVFNSFLFFSLFSCELESEKITSQSSSSITTDNTLPVASLTNITNNQVVSSNFNIYGMCYSKSGLSNIMIMISNGDTINSIPANINAVGMFGGYYASILLEKSGNYIIWIIVQDKNGKTNSSSRVSVILPGPIAVDTTIIASNVSSMPIVSSSSSTPIISNESSSPVVSNVSSAPIQ